MNKGATVLGAASLSEKDPGSTSSKDIITIIPADGAASPTTSMAPDPLMKEQNYKPKSASAGDPAPDSKEPQDRKGIASQDLHSPQTKEESLSTAEDKGNAKMDTILSLFNVQPIVRDNFDGMTLTWLVNELPMSQAAIQEHLATTKADAFPSILEAYQVMSHYEQEVIRIQLERFDRCRLVSVKRSFTDVTYRGVQFNHVPTLQFVLEHDIYGEIPGLAPKVDAAERKKELDWSRPTFIKVHRKHLSPETADAYDLPWESDLEDPNFLIIKRYINERDQDILFEHTRKLRELQKEKSSREARRNTPERGLDLPISPKESKKEVIFLKDPLNRTLILPFELCDTMDGLTQLLHDAFSPFKNLEPLVRADEYDLRTLKGETILPRAWKYTVKPGAEILMRWREGVGDRPEVVEVASDKGDDFQKTVSGGGIERCDEPVIVTVEREASH